MSKFVFHITEEQFDGMVELDIMTADQRGEDVELKSGPYIEMWMSSQEIYDILNALDKLGPDQEVFDQGQIANAYVNVSYGWDQYETSRGIGL